jgi:hypothetical protein
MTDHAYVDSLIKCIEVRDQLIGALKNQVRFLEKQLSKLEGAAFKAMTPAERTIKFEGAQPS